MELQNEEVAHEWLSRVPESVAQAVIFFDAGNQLCVIDREGAKETLDASPFAKQMDQCLVYLDESHTRGTDLKLPADYRAIVTLGPGLTKDPLVQGSPATPFFHVHADHRQLACACENSERDSQWSSVARWKSSGRSATVAAGLPVLSKSPTC